MTKTTNQLTVEGPVTGGDHGWPFGRPLFDLADHGYVEEEFFLAGEATTYRQVPGSEWGRDGHWQAEPTGSVPFRTRILVYRPADPDRFNGTTVVCWNNVTAGYELFGGESPRVPRRVRRCRARRCNGWASPGSRRRQPGPRRVGSRHATARLSIPTDDASYDIFTQVARAVGVDRDRSGVDPLGGLDVQRVIGLGASQSAARLATYVNAIHPIEHAFDGYMLQIYFGAGTALEVGDAIVNINAPTTAGTGSRVGLRGTNIIREDLDVPVMVVNSELEAIACYDVRQPDTDRFRYWESAGTCHVAIQSMDVRAPKYEREFGVAQPVMQQMNRIAITPLYDAALHHLNRWVGGGEAPPSQPLIEFSRRAGSGRPGPARHRRRRSPPPPGRGTGRPEQRDPARPGHLQHVVGLEPPVRRGQARLVVRRRGRLHRPVHAGRPRRRESRSAARSRCRAGDRRSPLRVPTSPLRRRR